MGALGAVVMVQVSAVLLQQYCSGALIDEIFPAGAPMRKWSPSCLRGTSSEQFLPLRVAEKSLQCEYVTLQPLRSDISFLGPWFCGSLLGRLT